MEELYRRADKFPTLDDNIRSVSQTVMITSQNSKPAPKGSSDSKNGQGKSQKRPELEKKKDPHQFTALNISYDRLLPLIRDLLEFKWPPPMRVGPDQRNRSLRCDYHKDHGHETNQCQSLRFLIERLILAGHLRRFLREPSRGATTAPTSDRAVVEIQHAPDPRPTINFIIGGPAGNEYQSRKQGSTSAVQLVDGPISFPPVNPTWVITPHYDVLVLVVCINGFDVHMVLIDPGSAADLLHLHAFKQMKVSSDHLHSPGRVLSGFNGATTLSIGDITFSVKEGHVTQRILFLVVEDLGRTWLHAMKAVPSTYHQTIS